MLKGKKLSKKIIMPSFDERYKKFIARDENRSSFYYSFDFYLLENSINRNKIEFSHDFSRFAYLILQTDYLDKGFKEHHIRILINNLRLFNERNELVSFKYDDSYFFDRRRLYDKYLRTKKMNIFQQAIIDEINLFDAAENHFVYDIRIEEYFSSIKQIQILKTQFIKIMEYILNNFDSNNKVCFDDFSNTVLHVIKNSELDYLADNFDKSTKYKKIADISNNRMSIFVIKKIKDYYSTCEEKYLLTDVNNTYSLEEYQEAKYLKIKIDILNKIINIYEEEFTDRMPICDKKNEGKVKNKLFFELNSEIFNAFNEIKIYDDVPNINAFSQSRLKGKAFYGNFNLEEFVSSRFGEGLYLVNNRILQLENKIIYEICTLDDESKSDLLSVYNMKEKKHNAVLIDEELARCLPNNIFVINSASYVLALVEVLYELFNIQDTEVVDGKNFILSKIYLIYLYINYSTDTLSSIRTNKKNAATNFINNTLVEIIFEDKLKLIKSLNRSENELFIFTINVLRELFINAKSLVFYSNIMVGEMKKCMSFDERKLLDVSMGDECINNDFISYIQMLTSQGKDRTELPIDKLSGFNKKEIVKKIKKLINDRGFILLYEKNEPISPDYSEELFTENIYLKFNLNTDKERLRYKFMLNI